MKKKSASPLKLWIGLGALVILVFGFGIYQFYRGDTETTQRAGVRPPSEGLGKKLEAAGKEAPGFKLKTPAGKEISDQDLRGNIVLLHYWASWCAPCIDEIPEIVHFANLFKGKPVKLVAISLDDRWEDALEIFPEKMESDNVISVIDPSIESANAYGSFQFPETYLIDKEFRIVTKWIGPQDWNHSLFKKLIEKWI